MEPLEQWRPVPVGGCSHLYEVSNLGRVKSLRNGRVLKPAATSKGYLSVVLYTDIAPKDGHSHLVHRLVCRAFHGEPRSGYEVDHVDSDKANNRACNLEWVTSSENTSRAVGSGALKTHKGSSHTNAKLSDDDVRAIRAAPQRRGVLAQLSRRFGVAESTVRLVRAGKSYRDVAQEPNP